MTRVLVLLLLRRRAARTGRRHGRRLSRASFARRWRLAGSPRSAGTSHGRALEPEVGGRAAGRRAADRGGRRTALPGAGRRRRSGHGQATRSLARRSVPTHLRARGGQRAVGLRAARSRPTTGTPTWTTTACPSWPSDD